MTRLNALSGTYDSSSESVDVEVCLCFLPAVTKEQLDDLFFTIDCRSLESNAYQQQELQKQGISRVLRR